MKILDLTFPSPEENLSCDETLLEMAESGYDHEIIRFWESPVPFVVLGYSSPYRHEIKLEFCRKNHIPIFRRITGGGTVLQGPGCLNYSLILNINASGPTCNITQTNFHILRRHQEALSRQLKKTIRHEGSTDLTLDGLKFSGNAQRRMRRCLLFHGTFLLKTDISMVEDALHIPARQPPYRKNRTHRNFLVNLNISAERMKEILRNSWQVSGNLERVPHENILRLVREKYSLESWNFKY